VAQAEPAVQVVLEASEDLLVLGVLEVLEVRVVQEGLGVQEDQLELEAPAELEVAAVVAAEPWATQLFLVKAYPLLIISAEAEAAEVLALLELLAVLQALRALQHLRVQQQAAPEVPEAAEPEVRQVLVALEVI
jgi:hypothetical protein